MKEELKSPDYEKAIEIADGIFWVGFSDRPSGLKCNPYLIVEEGEAVVIDGGSRPDFPTVMMKILQTGIEPESIVGLIYQHYDPDLVGSVSNFEDIIGSQDLKIISHSQNNMYIRHYSISSPLIPIETMDYEFRFASGRTLRFQETPYSHSPGSFVTLDEQSGILFTSDLFGSYGSQWELFLKLQRECHGCEVLDVCPNNALDCPVSGILRFHRQVMPSEKALRIAMDRILKLPFRGIAPQHGSVIPDAEDARLIGRLLMNLKGVGIDGISENGD